MAGSIRKRGEHSRELRVFADEQADTDDRDGQADDGDDDRISLL